MVDEKPAKPESEVTAPKTRRKRTQRPFPACSLEEAIEFAKSIHDFGSGQSVRRLSLFDHLGKSPESGTSRQLITNCGKYGLTEGSYAADQLSLTDLGMRTVNDDLPKREMVKARIAAGLELIQPFKTLYERIVGTKLPARQVLVDSLKEIGVDDAFLEEGVDTFTLNLKYVGLLQTLSGAERVVTTEHLLDTLPSSPLRVEAPETKPGAQQSSRSLVTLEQAGFDKTCFYVTPIGDEGSEFRAHSDLFLGSIIEPAIEPFGMSVVRADAIDKPGFITRQIMDYLMRSRLVVADLSYHNPNVFYELAIRHAARLPVVQIIRAADRVPFDLNQIRTIKIDTSDIYSLVPKLETYKAEISNQVRRALEDPDVVDSPITTFYPGYKLQKEYEGT